MKDINKLIFKKIIRDKKSKQRKKGKQVLQKSHNNYYRGLYENYINALTKNAKEEVDQYKQKEYNNYLDAINIANKYEDFEDMKFFCKDILHAKMNNDKYSNIFKNQYIAPEGQSNIIRQIEKEYENRSNYPFLHLDEFVDDKHGAFKKNIRNMILHLSESKNKEHNKMGEELLKRFNNNVY